jgi:diguanylate cyclase (GGDEF)-like protein
LIFGNIAEIETLFPDLISPSKQDEVIFGVAKDEHIFSNPFELVYGDLETLGLPDKTLSFSFLFSTHDPYLNLDHFIGQKHFAKELKQLGQEKATVFSEIAFTQGKKHILLSCLVYDCPKKKACFVGLRRLHSFEKFFDGFVAQSERDFTTSLLNKECCLKAIRNIRKDQKAVVVFADLNNFKLINDVYGHLIGDQSLKRFADTLKNNKPTNSNVYRYGGDEFVCVLRSSDMDDAKAYLEIVKEQLAIADSLSGIPLSFSAGAVAMAPSLKEPLYLIRCSDEAMYIAKKRDVTCYYLNEKEALGIIAKDQSGEQKPSIGL